MPTARSPVAPVADNIIHVSVFVTVPPARAFAYFTTPELLRQSLTAAADVEASVGGKYELFWQPDDRENNSTIGCKITAIEPDQFLSFEWRSPKQFKHFANDADPLTHVVVFAVPQGESTHVHLIHTGWRSTPEWEEARRWQDQAWSGAFERLEKLVNDESA